VSCAWWRRCSWITPMVSWSVLGEAVRYRRTSSQVDRRQVRFKFSSRFNLCSLFSLVVIFYSFTLLFSIKQRALVLIGVAVFSWALWLSRNDVVFQESKSKSCLPVMFRGTYWIRSLSILSREEWRKTLKRRLSLVGNYCIGILQWKWVECFQAYSVLVYVAFS
jgi:hypothetical protein